MLPNIPEDVWGARPILKDIRAAAHARGASADAVLWSLLVAIAAGIPARVRIETGLGVPVRPTLYAVLAGDSGRGKSTAWGVARTLLPDLPHLVMPSTGEGLIEAFYGMVWVDMPAGDGKTRPAKVKRRVRTNALSYLDEGGALFAQMARTGNTIAETLRSMWSGGDVGQHNADEDKRRHLEAGTYTFGLVVGLQPDISGALLADTSTGTAQRFLWCSATDPAIPVEPGLPQAVFWTPPQLPGGNPRALTVEDFLTQGKVWDPPEPLPPVTMTLDHATAVALRERQVRVRRGELDPDEHDSQRDAMRVKVAGVLAYTDARLHIEAEDWQLAEQLLRASDRVREALLDHAESVEHQQRTEEGERRAVVRKAEAEAEERCEEVARKVAALLVRASDGLGTSDIRRGLSRPQRAVLPVALAALTRRGEVLAEPGARGGTRYRWPLGE